MRDFLCLFAVFLILWGCAPSDPIPLLNPQVIDELMSEERADNIAGLNTLFGVERTGTFIVWFDRIIDEQF